MRGSEQERPTGQRTIVGKRAHQQRDPFGIVAMPGRDHTGDPLIRANKVGEVRAVFRLTVSGPRSAGHGVIRPGVWERAASNRRVTSAQLTTFHQAAT